MRIKCWQIEPFGTIWSEYRRSTFRRMVERGAATGWWIPCRNYTWPVEIAKFKWATSARQKKATTYTAQLIQIAKQQLRFSEHGVTFHLNLLERIHVNLLEFEEEKWIETPSLGRKLETNGEAGTEGRGCPVSRTPYIFEHHKMVVKKSALALKEIPKGVFAPLFTLLSAHRRRTRCPVRCFFIFAVLVVAFVDRRRRCLRRCSGRSGSRGRRCRRCRCCCRVQRWSHWRVHRRRVLGLRLLADQFAVQTAFAHGPHQAETRPLLQSPFLIGWISLTWWMTRWHWFNL